MEFMTTVDIHRPRAWLCSGFGMRPVSGMCPVSGLTA